MSIYHRAYDEQLGDYQKMWAFLEDDYAVKKEKYVWQTGRLGDWSHGLWNERKLFPSFKRKNAQVWLNDFGELVGFVLSEGCDNGFFAFARHGYEFLYPELLAWLKDNWHDRGDQLVSEVHEHQTEYMEALEQAGFHQGEVVAITQQYDLRAKAAEPISLPPGFRVVDMAAHPDYLAKAAVNSDGFGGKDDAPSSFEILRYEYSRENPCYFPDLDFSTVTEDGRHVSSCVGFPDYRNRFAEVEKVCTHRQFRRQGLAEAAIRACFHRLYAKGVEVAYITGYSEEAKGLYAKLGGCWSKRWFSYTIATGLARGGMYNPT
jgi:ribosomal protein S18 acetylase RimI-like enzyme